MGSRRRGRRLPALLCLLLAVSAEAGMSMGTGGQAQAASASGAAPAIISANDPDHPLLFGKREELVSTLLPQGMAVRSVHSFGDGTAAAYVNNALYDTPRGQQAGYVEELFLIGGADVWEERVRLPAGIEHPSGEIGLRSVVRAGGNDLYWAVRQGAVRSEYRAPHPYAQPVVSLLSSAILAFGPDGSVRRTVDLAALTGAPEGQPPVISGLYGLGDGLFVHGYVSEGGEQRIWSLDPRSGQLKGEIALPPGVRGVRLFVLAHGRLGMVYDADPAEPGQAAHRLATLYEGDGREVKTVDLGVLSQQLLASPSIIEAYPIRRGEEVVLEGSGGSWFVLDASFERVLSSSLAYSHFRTTCAGCATLQGVVLPLSDVLRAGVEDHRIAVLRFQPVTIALDGAPLISDSPPYLDPVTGTVWVPLRVTAEAFGARIAYDPAARVISLQQGDRVWQIEQDRPSIELRTLQEFGSTYVTLRELTALFGASVQWNQETYTVAVDSSAGTP